MRDKTFNLLLVAIIVIATESIWTINSSPCRQNEITVTDNSIDPCIPCASCPAGQELHPRCGSKITEQERGDIDCKNCKPGHYSDEYSPHPCKECHNCLDNQIVVKECTNTSDTICHKSCNKGYYFENSSLDCKRCSCCCGDSKDVKIEKCVSDKEPELNQCSSHRALECCKATTQSTVASSQPKPNVHVDVKQQPLPDGGIVGIVLGAIALLLIIIVIIFWGCKRRKKRLRTDKSQISSAANSINVQLPSSQINEITENTMHNDHTNESSKSNTGFDDSRKGSPSFNNSRETVLENASLGKTLPVNSKVPETGSSGKTCRIDEPLAESKRLSKRFRRQGSTESSSSGEGSEETGPGFHKSPSSRSLKDVLRKMSLRGKSLDEESLVDMEALEYQPEHQDESCSEYSMSNAPGPSKIKGHEKGKVELPKNKSFKLGDLNYDQREHIGKMLDCDKYGLGNTKKLAASYMDEYETESLLKCDKPGENLLGHIYGKFPNKTVYEFCEDLQQQGFERNDIVLELCKYVDEVDNNPSFSI